MQVRTFLCTFFLFALVHALTGGHHLRMHLHSNCGVALVDAQSMFYVCLKPQSTTAQRS